MRFFKSLLPLLALCLSFNAFAALPTVNLSNEESVALLKALRKPADATPAANASVKRIILAAQDYVPEYSPESVAKRHEIAQEESAEIIRLSAILNAPAISEETKLKNLSAALIAGIVGRLLDGRFPESIIVDGSVDNFLDLFARVYGVPHK